jgi:hypothetical protein
MIGKIKFFNNNNLSYLFYFIFFFSAYKIVESTFLLPRNLLPSAKERLEFIQVYGVFLEPFTILGSFTYQGDNFQPGPFGYLYFLTFSYLVSSLTSVSSFIAALYIFEIFFILLFFYSCFIIKKYFSLNMAFILFALIILTIIPRSCYTLSTQCILPMSPMPWYSLALVASLLVFFKSKNTFFAVMVILFSALMVQIHLVALPFSLTVFLYILFSLYQMGFFREFKYRLLFSFAIFNWLIIFINIFLSLERIFDKVASNSENKIFIFKFLVNNILYNFPIFDAYSNGIIGNSSYQYITIILAVIFIFAPILLFFINRSYFNKKIFLLFLSFTLINIFTIFIGYEEHQFNYNFGLIVFFITFLLAKFSNYKYYGFVIAVLAVILSFSNPFIANGKNRYDIEEFNDQRQIDDKTLSILNKAGAVKITNFDFYNNNSAVYINFIYELIEHRVEFCLEPPNKAINSYLQNGFNTKGDGNGVQVLEIFSYLNCSDKLNSSKYKEIIMIPDQKQGMPKKIPGYKLLTYLPNTFWGKCYSEDIYALAKDFSYQPEVGKYLNPPEGVLIGSSSTFKDKVSYFNSDRYFCGFNSLVRFSDNSFDTYEYFPAFPYFSQAIYIEDFDKELYNNNDISVINDLLNHAIMIAKKVRNSEFELPQFNSSINSYGAVEFYNLIIELYKLKKDNISLEDTFISYKKMFDSTSYDLVFTPNQVIYSSADLPFFTCKLDLGKVSVLSTPVCGFSEYPNKKLSYFPNESNNLDYEKLFLYLNNEIKEQIIVSMLNDYIYNYSNIDFNMLESFILANKDKYSAFSNINISISNFDIIVENGYDYNKYINILNTLLDKTNIRDQAIIKLKEFDIENNLLRIDNYSNVKKREKFVDNIYKTQKDYQNSLNNFEFILREIYEYNIVYKRSYGSNIWEMGNKGYEITFHFYNFKCAVNALKRYNFIYPKQYYYVTSCLSR